MEPPSSSLGQERTSQTPRIGAELSHLCATSFLEPLHATYANTLGSDISPPLMKDSL